MLQIRQDVCRSSRKKRQRKEILRKVVLGQKYWDRAMGARKTKKMEDIGRPEPHAKNISGLGKNRSGPAERRAFSFTERDLKQHNTENKKRLKRKDVSPAAVDGNQGTDNIQKVGEG